MTAEPQQTDLQSFWKRAVRLAKVLLVVGSAALYVVGGRALALGLVLGAGVSVVRFDLRYRALLKGRPAATLVRLRLASYALSAAALGLAFGFPHLFSPWSAAPGLLAMNLCVIVAEMTVRGTEGRAPDSAGS